MPRTLFTGSLLLLGVAAYAQTSKNVPCYPGDSYFSCTPARALSNRRALAKAKSATVIIDATEGIACGDGSDGCIRPDNAALTTIVHEIEESELWQNLSKAEAKKADILLKFKTKDHASLQLCAYDAETNDLLWCEYRNPAVALSNDAARELVHFIAAWKASQK